MVCGGLWWFACIVSGFTAYAPNSGGDLWWFAVMCGGFFFSRWFVVVCGHLRSIVVVCLLVIPMDIADPQIAPNRVTLTVLS